MYVLYYIAYLHVMMNLFQYPTTFLKLTIYQNLNLKQIQGDERFMINYGQSISF